MAENDEKKDEGTFQQISGVFGLVNKFNAKAVSETRPFMDFNKHIFWSQKLRKYLTYGAHFFRTTLDITCRLQIFNQNHVKG